MSSSALEQQSTVLVADRRAAQRTAFAQSFVLHAIAVSLAILFAFPLYWMLITSVKPVGELDNIPPTFWPETFRFQNYYDALLSSPSRYFPHFFWNTTVYTLLAITGNLLSNTTVAYGFARIPFRGRNFLFILVLSTMMVPSQVLLIPQYLLFKQFGWLDSLLPLVVPAFFGSAFYIFLLRQFFLTLPRELDEAATIDGASHFDIFWRIILPLSRPILITVFALSFVAHWNDFFGPLIYLNSNDKLVLSVALRLFLVPGMETPMHLLMAAAVVTVLPVILVFLVCQQYFVRGIAMSGLKG